MDMEFSSHARPPRMTSSATTMRRSLTLSSFLLLFPSGVFLLNLYPRLTGSLLVLEIGTFIGFSTLGWVDAVGKDGHVTALEFSPEYAKIAEDTFAKNGIKNAEVIVGDARES